MRCLLVSVGGCGAVLVAGTFAMLGGRAGSSAVVGVATAILNLWALRAIVGVLVHAAATGQRGGLGFFIVPKTLGLLGIVWLLFSRHFVMPGAWAIGYAALPIGVAIGVLVCDKAA